MLISSDGSNQEKRNQNHRLTYCQKPHTQMVWVCHSFNICIFHLSLHRWLIFCSTEAHFGTFLIRLAVSISHGLLLFKFLLNVLFLSLLMGHNPFSNIKQYFVSNDLKKRWMKAKNNLWYRYCYCGLWGNLYQMCYSCTQLCSNYFEFLF